MKMKECVDTVDIICQLEGGELIVEDADDLNRLKSLCAELMYSQGFYGRLYRDIVDNEDYIEFPLVF